MSIEVRELRPEDWQIRRDVRLAALLDSPAAFVSTHAETSTRTEAEWRVWPRSGALFGAWFEGAPAGMVGIGDGGTDGTAYLFAMWVAPVARGRGVADRLIDAAAQWARDNGFRSILLEVATGNERAERFYRRLGFQTSDDPTHDTCDLAMRLAVSPATVH
jgi:ribosomal protein S18 acetylase RimI-like enzyme